MSEIFDTFVHRAIERCINACLRKHDENRYVQMKDLIDAGQLLDKRKKEAVLTQDYTMFYKCI